MNPQPVTLPPSVGESPLRLANRRAFRYGPFLFDSEIDIPELHGGVGSAEISVAILLDEVPKSLPGGTVFDAQCQTAPNTYQLDIDEIARYLVRDGRTVTIQPYPGATLGDVTIYLLGSVFGALCHQNGLLPLHASAVAVNGEVTAFLGDSGAGKSTFAAFLGGRGQRIVSDDICLLDLRAGDALPVIPVAVWMKLWRQSIERIGGQPEASNRIFNQDDKYRVFLQANSPMESPVETQELHLANLVFLERPGPEDDAETTSLEPISGILALSRLLDTIYLSYLVEATGELPRVFQRCSAILNRAKAYRLLAPRRWECMNDGLDLVERELLHGSRR